MSKACRNCRVEKPIGEFQRDCHRKDGYSGQCKECRRAYLARPEVAARNKERHSEWYAQHPEKRKQYNEHNRNRVRERLYGVTADEVSALGSACAICGALSSGARSLHVDHDHSTGKVRGLLCSTCNTSLGGFRDDPALLLRAVEYLRQAEA